MTKHKHKRKHKHKHRHRHKHKHRSNDDDKEKEKEETSTKTMSIATVASSTSDNLGSSPTLPVPAPDPISLDDYFVKNTEFRAWLHSRGKHFDEVRSPRRRYFPKFVRKWNEGQLGPKFYKGEFSHDERLQSFTGYHWGFENELPRQEDSSRLVDRTERGDASLKATGIKRRAMPVESVRGDAADEEKEFRRDVARYKRKRQRQRDQSVHEAALDEVAPKETGRERELQKRREKADRIHGSAQEKDELRDGTAGYSDDFLMGGSDNTLEELKKNRRLREQHKMKQRQERLHELREKESQRMQRFKQAMGITEGQEIKIRPRDD